MSTPYSTQHRWMEWLVDVQVASRGCGSPVCLHTSRLGTAASALLPLRCRHHAVRRRRTLRYHRRRAVAMLPPTSRCRAEQKSIARHIQHHGGGQQWQRSEVRGDITGGGGDVWWR